MLLPISSATARGACRRTRCIAALLTLTISIASPAAAQNPPARSPRPDFSVLAPIGLPSPAELAAIERGDVVVRVLPTADRDEVALLGVASMSVPRDFYFARARSASVALDEPGRAAFGVFHVPPTEADIARAVLDPSDAAGLKTCRVSHCSIKLPAQEMTAIARAIDWSRVGDAEGAAHVDSLVRRWLVALVTDYRARGSAAMPVYDDTRAGERSASGFLALLGENAFLLRDAPSFATYLAGSPESAVPGAESTIYWSQDQRPGLKPILSVSQRSTFHGAGDGAPMLVAVKQLYASHYFDAWLDIALLIEQSGPMPSTNLVLVRRVRFDRLPNRGLFDIRGRVVRRLRDELRQELARTKQATEAAYHER